MEQRHGKPAASRTAPAWVARLNSDAAQRALPWIFPLVVLIFAGVAVANSIIPGKSMKDYGLWHETGQRMLHGDAIYPVKRSKFPFMYPPAAAALLAPVSVLGKTGLVVALAGITGAAWLASILLSVRLATGTWARQHLLLYALPSLCVIGFVWSNFHLGQPSLVLLGLLLGAFLALQVKREPVAGALVALAAGIKAFPFIAIVYLLYRRYWLAVASLIVSLALLLLVLPAAFRGLPNAAADLQRWTKGMLLKYDEKGVAQRPGRGNSWKNQSIFGLANRMLRRVDANEQFGPHEVIYVNVADLSFAAVNRIIVGAGLLLGLAYLAVMPRRNERTRDTDGVEFALFILLMLMFTPLSFGYLFACLLFPFTVLIARVIQGAARHLWISGGIAVLLLVLSIPAQRTAQLYGNYFFAALSLFVGLAFELWKEKQAAGKAVLPSRVSSIA